MEKTQLNKDFESINAAIWAAESTLSMDEDNIEYVVRAELYKLRCKAGSIRAIAHRSGLLYNVQGEDTRG